MLDICAAPKCAKPVRAEGSLTCSLQCFLQVVHYEPPEGGQAPNMVDEVVAGAAALRLLKRVRDEAKPVNMGKRCDHYVISIQLLDEIERSLLQPGSEEQQ